MPPTTVEDDLKQETTITERILGHRVPPRRDFRRRVHKRDDWTCRLCGRRDTLLSPATLTVTPTGFVFTYGAGDGEAAESVRVDRVFPRVERDRLSLVCFEANEFAKRRMVAMGGRMVATGPPRSLRRRWNVDHIVPLALGGVDDMDNLQLLCPACAFFKEQQDLRNIMERLKLVEEARARGLPETDEPAGYG